MKSTVDIILKDKNGEGLQVGDRVIVTDENGILKGRLVYDKAFFAHAVIGDDDLRYLLMDMLYVSDLQENGDSWHREIEKECW